MKFVLFQFICLVFCFWEGCFFVCVCIITQRRRFLSIFHSGMIIWRPRHIHALMAATLVNTIETIKLWMPWFNCFIAGKIRNSRSGFRFISMIFHSVIAPFFHSLFSSRFDWIRWAFCRRIVWINFGYSDFVHLETLELDWNECWKAPLWLAFQYAMN